MTLPGHRRGPSRLRARITLLGSVFVVAACGLVYELVAASVSSYLLGDAVTQFSLVIGVFLSAMGLGSWLARFVTRDLVRAFVEVEIWIGLVGGTSSLVMFAASAWLGPVFEVVFYAQCITIGTLVGLEIPLLVRILRELGGLTAALSDTLALDYLGALAGAVLFPLLALPYLGVARASVVFGLVNLVVAAVGITLIDGRRAGMIGRWAAAAAIVVGTFVASGAAVGFLEDVLYQDDVIYAASSPYQRIVLTRWRGDVRLYINGNIQFSSVDEARYHEPLVIPAMEAVPGRRSVLVLGGGDGLAAREVLRYDTVETVVVVDLDPEVTDLGTHRRELVALNEGSLSDPRVRVVNDDAMLFAEASESFFDVILVDLPDPNSDTLAKLYSREFYALLARRLSDRGVLVTQATSPYFARDAFWCIVATLEGATDARPLHVLPFHAHVPSFGEWGFAMASHHSIDPTSLAPSGPTRFLDAATLHAMFRFPLDLSRPEALQVNRLDDPVVFSYYKRGWSQFNR